MRKYPDRVKVKCAFCGAILSKCPSLVHSRNFCSNICRGSFQKTLTGDKCHNWKNVRIEKLCIICGNKFTVNSSYRRDTAKFCSTKCMGIWNSRFKGSLSQSWKGGLTVNLKEYRLMQENKRRAIKMKDYCTVSMEEWENLKNQREFKCVCCGRAEPEIKLTQDHIIPISRGGPNHIGNIQPLCKSCNSKKFTKSINFFYGFKITNIDLIPEEFLMLDEAKIGALVRSLKRAGEVIPGVESYSEKQ